MVADRRVLLLLLVLVGGGLRFYDLGGPSLWLDEVLSVDDSRDLGRALTSFAHPPLPYLALHAWVRVFGESDAALRSLAAVAGTLSIPLVYLVARRAFPYSGVALAAAALLAVMPAALWHSREVRHYTLWPAFTLLALWALLAQRAPHPPRRAALVYWLSTALGTATHYYMGFYAAAHALAAWLLIGDRPLAKTRGDVRRWIVLHLPILAVVLLLLGYRWWVWGRLRGLGAARAVPGSFGRVLWWLSSLVFFRPWAYADPPREAVLRGAVIALALVIAFVLALRDRRVNPAVAWALAIALWLPFLAIELLPIRSYTRLHTPTLALLVLWLAYLAARPLAWRAARAARGAALAALLVALVPYGRAAFELEVEPWKTVCAEIAAGETADAIVLVNEPFMIRPLRRCYAARAPIVGFPDPARRLSVATIADFAAPYGDVWLVYSHAWRTDPRRGGLRALLATHALVARHHHGPLIDVFHLRRAAH